MLLLLLLIFWCLDTALMLLHAVKLPKLEHDCRCTAQMCTLPQISWNHSTPSIASMLQSPDSNNMWQTQNTMFADWHCFACMGVIAECCKLLNRHSGHSAICCMLLCWLEMWWQWCMWHHDNEEDAKCSVCRQDESWNQFRAQWWFFSQIHEAIITDSLAGAITRPS